MAGANLPCSDFPPRAGPALSAGGPRHFVRCHRRGRACVRRHVDGVCVTYGRGCAAYAQHMLPCCKRRDAALGELPGLRRKELGEGREGGRGLAGAPGAGSGGTPYKVRGTLAVRSLAQCAAGWERARNDARALNRAVNGWMAAGSRGWCTSLFAHGGLWAADAPLRVGAQGRRRVLYRDTGPVRSAL